ncbi:hypothetical protein TRIUR3_14944 [Triticum urartu]|uniref:COX assembly mitochondrial protein n=1 Tax=Triticum urartu TaxID=4572 RepID=M7YX53_TRIUA|nr:hypothetical protein TRIUR3_14944 [Triticum urartu]
MRIEDNQVYLASIIYPAWSEDSSSTQRVFSTTTVTLVKILQTFAPLCQLSILLQVFLGKAHVPTSLEMHPHLTLHRHPMCAEIIEEFQKCHVDHPIKKFFGECTDLKIKLDRCFRQEKAVKRKANFEESKKFKERLQAYKKEMAEKENES